MWKAVAIFLCYALQATECPDESTRLLPRDSGQILGFAKEYWRTQIRTRLGRGGEVHIFYFPKADERYSVTYDANASLVRVDFVFKGRHEKAIVPLTYALHQEILQGYVLNSRGRVPSITGADFSEKNVDLRHYCRQKFFSQHLDGLLIKSIPTLVDQGRESFDHDEKCLTADMLKSALRKKTERFLWQVVYASDALDILGKIKKKPEMLLIIGGVGMLWGRLTNCLLRNVHCADNRSLLHYKLDKALDAICSQYPFSVLKSQVCLNYSGQNTVAIWRAKIKKSLTQNNHVRVFYFAENNECCSASYNVSSEEVVRYCVWADGTSKMAVFPMPYFLQQIILKGYVLQQGHPPPRIRDIDFSDTDVDLEHYSRKQFFSEDLDDVLIGHLPHCDVVARGCLRKLNREGKICSDRNMLPTIEELSVFVEDMRARVLPRREDNQHFCWNIVHEDEAMEILYEPKNKPEMLLVIGGVGMLWGRLAGSLSQGLTLADHRSLLHYKMASVIDAIYAKYGCPQEEPRSFFDYMRQMRKTQRYEMSQHSFSKKNGDLSLSIQETSS